MTIWHSVISVSGIKVRYNPSTQELRLTCVKRVLIKLTELSDFYVIQVSLSSSSRNSKSVEHPPNPPSWRKSSGRKIAPLTTKETPQHLKLFEAPQLLIKGLLIAVQFPFLDRFSYSQRGKRRYFTSLSGFWLSHQPLHQPPFQPLQLRL